MSKAWPHASARDTSNKPSMDKLPYDHGRLCIKACLCEDDECCAAVCNYVGQPPSPALEDKHPEQAWAQENARVLLLCHAEDSLDGGTGW